MPLKRRPWGNRFKIFVLYLLYLDIHTIMVESQAPFDTIFFSHKGENLRAAYYNKAPIDYHIEYIKLHQLQKLLLLKFRFRKTLWPSQNI